MLTVVAHSDHDGSHVLQRRVAEHGDLVLRLTRGVVVDDVRYRVAHTLVAAPFSTVTGCLRVGQHLQRKVEHVVLRPYCCTVGGAIVVILSRRRQMQRNLIFVVVVAQVGTQTDEATQVAVLQLRINGGHLLGMDEHLQFLVLPQVVAGVLVHSACV